MSECKDTYDIEAIIKILSLSKSEVLKYKNIENAYNKAFFQVYYKHHQNTISKHDRFFYTMKNCLKMHAWGQKTFVVVVFVVKEDRGEIQNLF